jgi:hypothetical protein
MHQIVFTVPLRLVAAQNAWRGSHLAETQALRSQLWRLSNELRGTLDGSNPLHIARRAVLEGLAPTWRDQAVLAQEVGVAEAADPAVVADFLLAYTKGMPPLRVLDPWAGFGITMAALDEAKRLRPSVAIEINQDVYSVVMAMRSTDRIEWLLGDSRVVLGQPRDPFDLVVGSPPTGMHKVEVHVGERTLRVSETYVMVAQAASQIDTAGELAIVLPESFMHESRGAVRELLAEAGAYPKALLALPRRGFPSSIAMSLVLFDREPHEDLFVAELQPSTDLPALVANMRARRTARLPALGRVVAPSAFRSWAGLVLGEEINRQARAMGLVPVPFADLCRSIQAIRPNQEGEASFANAVYMPSVGFGPVSTSTDQLHAKVEPYLRLEVNEDRADAEYVAAFLNTSLGRAVRQGLASGVIPRVSLSAIESGTAFLPPTRDHQRSTMALDRRLRELDQAVASLRRRLWEDPLHARTVGAELRSLVEGEGLDRWRDALPFPLASVLWRYDAEDDPEAKCRYLVHFFEALTLLLVDIHWSGLQQEPGALGDARRSGGPAEPYARASIGAWSDLLARLAKRTRALVGQDRALASEVFRVSDLERLERVASVALTSTIKDEAATYRNNWIGHSARVRDDEWRRRLALAEETLAKIRGGLGDAFEGWELIRAGRGGNHGGVISLSIERVTGPQRAFRRSTVELQEWPIEGRLYMLEAGATAALALSPLLALKRGPASTEDACYFFDRLEGDSVRWVSFHFEGDPEVRDNAPDVHALIAELNALG